MRQTNSSPFLYAAPWRNVSFKARSVICGAFIGAVTLFFGGSLVDSYWAGKGWCVEEFYVV